MRMITRISFTLLLAALLAACSVNEAPSNDSEDAIKFETLGTLIIVNTTTGFARADGRCSLIEAIQAANTDTAVDACPAGSGADTIYLGAGQTYYLGQRFTQIERYSYVKSALPVITQDLTIEGNGATIKGPYPYRQYDMTLIVNWSDNLSLNNLTLSGAYSSSRGAAIEHQWGHLKGSRLTISNNKTDSGAAAINSSSAKISLTQCVIEHNESNNGVAGIRTYATRISQYNPKTIKLEECIIRNNKTATGVAAIKSTGDMSIVELERSSVTHNEVKEHVFSSNPAFRWPAIVYNDDDARMQITNSSLAENTGKVFNVIFNGARLDMNFATIYKNESRINARAVYGLFTTFEAESDVQNTAMVRQKFRDGAGSINHSYGNCGGTAPKSNGYNFDSDGSCQFSEATDVQDKWQWAMLLPLSDNGGFTPTYEPAGWSKLRNAGDDYSHFSISTDQRGKGFDRKTSSSSDIGAVETCESYRIFWLIIIPLPICVEENQTMKLSIPLNESPLEELAELNEVLELPCETCDLALRLEKDSVIYAEFDSEKAEAYEGVVLYSAKGERVAEGRYALKAELPAGLYYFDLMLVSGGIDWAESVDVQINFD